MIELDERTDNQLDEEQQLLSAIPITVVSAADTSNNGGDNINKGLYYDLTRTIGDVLNYMGRYQKILFIALALNGIIYGINHTLTAFHVYRPEFYCDVSHIHFFTYLFVNVIRTFLFCMVLYKYGTARC